MLNEDKLNKLDEILYFMNNLENIKNTTTRKSSLESKKTIFLLENCIDEIIARSKALQIKINKNKGNDELKIASILSLITYPFISQHSKTGYYNYDKTSKRNIDIYKYPVIYLWEFMQHILFLKKEIEKATGLNGVFSESNTGTAELLKLYLEDIEFQKEYEFEFLDCLKEKKQEYLLLKKEILKEEKQNTKTKYITDYKYPAKTKNSIHTVRNNVKK